MLVRRVGYCEQEDTVTGAAMTQTSVPVPAGVNGGSELLTEVLAALRGAVRDEAHDVVADAWLRGACRRFAQSARDEGVSPERVVIALKHTYNAIVPASHRDREDQLSGLVTVLIESYYGEEQEEPPWMAVIA
jgi:hypothetical protein